MSDRREALHRFLLKTPFFGGLDDAALDRIIAMLGERRLANGETVYRQGEQGRSMYIVEAGTILLCNAAGPCREVKLTRLGPGDFFGDTTLIEMQPRPSTARAECEAHLLELTNMDLYALYKSDVRSYVMVLQNMNRELCRRLRRSDARIIQLADESGDETTQIGPLPGTR